MRTQAKGSFDIQSTANPARSLGDGLAVGHMTFQKQLHGDLTGTGVVEMLGIMNREIGSGAYVALERITGTLHGKSGAFCTQHGSTMDRGKPTQRIEIVPDSGTGELAGIRGTMTIDIVEGKHFYTLDYTL
jgi:hypothetical protein